MKKIALGKLFTEQELAKAAALWAKTRMSPLFHSRVRDEVVIPAMPRINKVTGQENDADYMAYMLEAVFTQGK
jgi:hypothetical protein